MRAFSERLGSSVRERTAAVGSVETRTQQRQLERRKRTTHAGKQKKMEELLRHDLWLSAEECLKLGLVDEIC